MAARVDDAVHVQVEVVELDAVGVGPRQVGLDLLVADELRRLRRPPFATPLAGSGGAGEPTSSLTSVTTLGNFLVSQRKNAGTPMVGGCARRRRSPRLVVEASVEPPCRR
jgi:hypothetical protein